MSRLTGGIGRGHLGHLRTALFAIIGSIDTSLDCAEQGTCVDGLRRVVIHSGVQVTLTVTLHGVCGQGDDGGIGNLFIG